MAIGTRVIKGELKGFKIGPLPHSIFARPILARINKSLFDILRNRVPGSVFLDLFSGSGSVGIEALSLGAKKVVFVDVNPQCQKWIRNLLDRISRQNQNFFRHAEYQVHRADVMAGLGWLNEKFDLIFSGAPYKDQSKKQLFFVRSLLDLLDRDQILKPDGWFIAQHDVRETFDVPNTWDLFRQEQYGDTAVSFFKKQEARSKEVRF